MKKRKIVLHNEIMYFVAIIILSLAVATLSNSRFGVSMIAAPAKILSLRFTFLTFGQWEYIVAGVCMAIFCIIIKKFKVLFLFSFLNSFLYGLCLDFFRQYIPILNPNYEPPLYIRIIMFIAGMILTGISIAIFYRTYLYPQIYDFSIKEICKKFNKDLVKGKRIMDLLFLLASVILSFACFLTINTEGIGIGTVIMALLNGIVIGFFGKILDRFFTFRTIFPKLEAKFRL